VIEGCFVSVIRQKKLALIIFQEYVLFKLSLQYIQLLLKTIQIKYTFHFDGRK
jgi:hypothetical protein